VAVSLNYRLAPEHVFPAAVEDCIAVAKWLIEHGESVFGTSSLSIGGESAGAHLAALTLTKLDAPTRAHFRAANLLFGCYDLSLTPSVRNTEAAPFVNRAIMEQFTSAFAGEADVRDPAISPLYADLRKMPPAFFSVGSIDPLLDDSLFMYARWLAAGNQAKLALYPGGTHGFNSFDGELARAANINMARFLAKNR
jgi:acetyl esterase/lipase